MTLEERFRRWFGDDETTRLGSGWTSGVVSVFVALVGLVAVVCLHLPARLTLPALRAVYPLAAVRAAAEIAVGAAFLIGLVSVALALLAGLLAGGACRDFPPST